MSQRGKPWELPLGDSQTYTVTIYSNGAALTGVYAGTETLTATVWEGSNIAALSGVLTPSWISGPAGTTACTVNGSATASLTQGYYRVKLEVTYNSQTSPYYQGWLRLLPIPGTAVEPPTYGALQDLLDRGGDWLPQLMQGAGETNFLFERGRARSWLDELIVNKSRPYAYQFDLTYALTYGSFPFGPVESPDAVIKGYLTLNYLMLNDRVTDIVSYKALSLICAKRVAFDEDGERYRQLAAYYDGLARRSLRGYRATLDINSDGIADIAFNMGEFSFR